MTRSWLDGGDRAPFEVRLRPPTDAEMTREFGDLAIVASAGADVLDLVREMRQPLDLSDPALGEPPPRPPVRTPPTFTQIMLPVKVRGAIDQHSRAMPPAHEAIGRLVVAGDGRALRYVELTNHTTAPRRFRHRSSWRPGDEEWGVLVHTHPTGSPPQLSAADVNYANAHDLSVLGVWHDDTATLHVYQREPYASAFVSVPVDVERPRVPAAATVQLDAAIVPGRRRVTACFTVLTAAGRVLDRDGNEVQGGYELVARRLMGGR